MKVSAFGFEGMLLRWANSSTGGPQITIQLQSEEDLVPFQNMTLAKGKQAGQRLMIGVSLIGDQETAVPVEVTEKERAGAKAHSTSRFPDGFTGLAVKWCIDEQFQAWLWDQFPADRVEELTREEWCKMMICDLCGVDSRKLLDTDPDARILFNDIFRAPYMEFLKEKTA